MADPTFSVLLLSGRFEVRGSTVQTLTLAQRLPPLGFRVQVVCPDAGTLSPQVRKELNLRVYPSLELPMIDRLARYFIARDLEAAPPDLIHIQQRAMLPLGAWLAQRLERPYLLSVHDYLSARESLRFDTVWGRKVIAVSHSVRDEFLALTRLPPDLVTVIPSGVVASNEPRQPVLEPGRVPVVGTAGPLEASKGLRFFLEAARLVQRTHPHVEFLIAGAGPEEGNLRRQGRALGIADRLTFVPNMFDFSSSLAALDLFVLPSLKQGLGTIMLEAMARGLPVIATSAGGVYSVVSEGQTGLLVPPSDSAALATRITELLDDPLRARSIGQNAREMVLDDFPVDRMAQRTADLYRTLLPSAAPA